ncbi:MAG: 7-cyano-7-deazaguanine synthase QueC [Verrucomicrobiae bacterium]|nr:7-cyano-7-deazaguanine synthase QueC [Verrucomicrobiae bacterium]
MKLLVLLSGGLDSVTALYHARENHDVIGALSFDYGSKHNHCELPLAAYHTNKLDIPHVILPLTFINDYFQSTLLKSGGKIPEGHYAAENMKQTVVPFRNGIMLSIAGGFAESHGAQGIVIGAHAGDHFIYADCRETFLEAMSSALREGTDTRVGILRPFVEMDKGAIVRRGMELGIDYSKTWSCYKGEELQCGFCGTCVERKEAFMLAGIKDPTHYEIEKATFFTSGESKE